MEYERIYFVYIDASFDKIMLYTEMCCSFHKRTHSDTQRCI